MNILKINYPLQNKTIHFILSYETQITFFEGLTLDIVNNMINDKKYDIVKKNFLENDSFFNLNKIQKIQNFDE
jgi:hypothetical protein